MHLLPTITTQLHLHSSTESATMTSVQIPNADPSVLTNTLKPEAVEHKEAQIKTNGNGYANGHINGHTNDKATGNDNIEYTSGIVKEALAYTGRGRPLRV